MQLPLTFSNIKLISFLVIPTKGQPGVVAIFTIPTLTDGNQLILSECWCKDHFKRDYNSNEKNSSRIYIEKSIVDKVAETITDKDKSRILLINLGSDHVGLLVILSKLYLLGI
jgi:hypothetical protein